MNLEGKKVTLHDMSLRDGMHPQRHQLTTDQMIQVATALDTTGSRQRPMKSTSAPWCRR
jgi:4-hydroxy-2-oxovalerate/4-hydroxy-2-oxohexanoate aldolase